MSNYYELSKQALAVEEAIEREAMGNKGEVPKELILYQQALSDSIEENSRDCARLMNKLADEAEMLKGRAKKLTDAANKKVGTYESLKSSVKVAMESVGLTKCEGFSICKNGGKLPLRINGKVPDEYLKYEPSEDKEKIRETLEAGAKLEFAEIGERGSHVHVKVW